MAKEYIRLTENERDQLAEIAGNWQQPPLIKCKANILLMADVGAYGPGLPLNEIAKATNSDEQYTLHVIAEAAHNGAVETVGGAGISCEKREGKLEQKRPSFRLSEEERNQIELIATDQQFSSLRRRRASILLLADNSPDGAGLSGAEIQREIGVSGASAVIRRAMENGAIQTVMGQSRVGVNKGKPQRKKLAPEVEEKIAALDEAGNFTRAEIARRYGISGSTVTRIVDRNNPSR